VLDARLQALQAKSMHARVAIKGGRLARIGVARLGNHVADGN